MQNLKHFATYGTALPFVLASPLPECRNSARSHSAEGGDAAPMPSVFMVDTGIRASRRTGSDVWAAQGMVKALDETRC